MVTQNCVITVFMVTRGGLLSVPWTTLDGMGVLPIILLWTV